MQVRLSCGLPVRHKEQQGNHGDAIDPTQPNKFLQSRTINPTRILQVNTYLPPMAANASPVLCRRSDPLVQEFGVITTKVEPLHTKITQVPISTLSNTETCGNIQPQDFNLTPI